MGMETGKVGRPKEARNRTDRQAGKQTDRETYRKAWLETVKVGRQERRKKTDRQVGARQLDKPGK